MYLGRSLQQSSPGSTTTSAPGDQEGGGNEGAGPEGMDGGEGGGTEGQEGGDGEGAGEGEGQEGGDGEGTSESQEGGESEGANVRFFFLLLLSGVKICCLCMRQRQPCLRVWAAEQNEQPRHQRLNSACLCLLDTLYSSLQP